MFVVVGTIVILIFYIPIHIVRSRLRARREREYEKTTKIFTYTNCQFTSGKSGAANLKGWNASISIDPRYFVMRNTKFSQVTQSGWDFPDGLRYLSVIDSKQGTLLAITDRKGLPYTILIPSETADDIWKALDSVSALPRLRFYFPPGHDGKLPTVELGPIKVMDGAGWSPTASVTGRLRVFEDYLSIGGVQNSEEVQLDSLSDIQIDGDSLTTGGGFIGGGLGVKGAAEGIVLSSILNEVSTSTDYWVDLKIVTGNGWTQVRLEKFDADDVRNSLRGLSDRIVQNQIACKRENESKSPDSAIQEGDFVGELERLKELHDSGALSDEEFAASKAKIVNGPSR